MILLNAVIQVFILPDFNPLLRLTFRIEEGERGGIGPTFIDSHDGGSAVLAYRFTEKTPGSHYIAASGQQEVNRLTVGIDRPVKVFGKSHRRNSKALLNYTCLRISTILFSLAKTLIVPQAL
ncbi:hypothetical protein XBO1_350002 [Xenorhabdus bovienii str. oregonense]|uniref:Uncharacterized protein n=1 Tax=Xenorhabdus bovienii str. oregonense TaxID=1398202 RepID=A0A077P9P7_XENBV|nr:hypothetical protein XBO1_350002 [Xenorhabdus bovienii str. oregonense]